MKIYEYPFREKHSALCDISISQRGLTLAFQILRRLSYDLCAHLESELDQTQDQSLYIAVLVWEEAEHSFV